VSRRRDPSAVDLDQLMGARPFGYIYKPKYSSDVVCSGEVETREDGSWLCLKCGATSRRNKRQAGASTEHREIKESAFWAFSYSHEGKKHNLSVRSRDHRDAVKLKHEILKRILGGRLPWLNPKEPTLAEVLEMVRAHYLSQGNRSLRSLELYVRTLLAYPPFEGGAIKAKKITEQRVEDYKAWRKGQGRANGTINRELQTLSQGFKMATSRVDEDGRPVLERMPRIRMLREAPPREGFFEDEEFEAVRRELLLGAERTGPEDLADLAEFYYLTGWRSAEPRALKASSVNWFAETITLPAAVNKSGRAREFPFGEYPRLKALLKRRRQAAEEAQLAGGRKIPWLFFRRGKPGSPWYGQPIRSFRRAWKAACARAGVPERTPHDFRRTAARNVYQATGNLVAACYLVGWESIQMAKRYKIDTLKDRAEAVARLASWQSERERAREAARQMALKFGKGS
jgi:integrase